MVSKVTWTRVQIFIRKLFKIPYYGHYIDYDEELLKAKIRKENSLRRYHNSKSFIHFLYIIILILVIYMMYYNFKNFGSPFSGELKLPFLNLKIY